MIYAVPGHPLIGEASVQRVLTLARERGLSTSIVAGVSFLEPVCTALELDPLEAGTQLFDATTLAALGDDEVAGKIIPTLPLLVGQVYNRRLASAVKLVLSEVYPDEWPVKLVRAAGVGDDETVVTLPLYELDRGTSLANHLSTLYVPPVDELTALRLPETLRYITMRLRREPDGCPWDRKQTHQSLTRYVIEETYEVVEALEENDMEKLADELGDLLLQVYLHSEIARQEGEFAISDVFEHVNAKLIRRHPHVFGDARGLTPEARKVMLDYAWPGNVRQLESAIERAILLAESDYIAVEDLPLEVRQETRPAAEAGFKLPADGVNFEDVERNLILQAMERTDYNITKAAKLLGLTFRTLQYRLEKFGIKRPDRHGAREEEEGDEE